MRYGGSLPVDAWGDVAKLRDIAQALDNGGMDYVSLATHILAMPAGSVPEEMPHHYQGPYREPITLFAWLAGQTRRIVFRPAVMILPYYNTALLAKQAADVAIMSDGRLELGVGISWNPREYEALGQDFHVRGARLVEQVTLLRRLWTEPYVEFTGRWHTLHGLGLGPGQLPPRIPIYLGAGPDERLLRRVARIGDGWIPLVDPVEPLSRLHGYLRDGGRDVAAFNVSGRLMARDGNPDEWLQRMHRLVDAGINDIEIFPGRNLSAAEAASQLLGVRDILKQEFG